MGFLFSDVYTKAIALFDDPRITKAYETDRVQFSKIMYTYMQNAIKTGGGILRGEEDPEYLCGWKQVLDVEGKENGVRGAGAASLHLSGKRYEYQKVHGPFFGTEGDLFGTGV